MPKNVFSDLMVIRSRNVQRLPLGNLFVIRFLILHRYSNRILGFVGHIIVPHTDKRFSKRHKIVIFSLHVAKNEFYSITFFFIYFPTKSFSTFFYIATLFTVKDGYLVYFHSKIHKK